MCAGIIIAVLAKEHGNKGVVPLDFIRFVLHTPHAPTVVVSRFDFITNYDV
jgi:hypothetical protein